MANQLGRCHHPNPPAGPASARHGDPRSSCDRAGVSAPRSSAAPMGIHHNFSHSLPGTGPRRKPISSSAPPPGAAPIPPPPGRPGAAATADGRSSRLRRGWAGGLGMAESQRQGEAYHPLPDQQKSPPRFNGGPVGRGRICSQVNRAGPHAEAISEKAGSGARWAASSSRRWAFRTHLRLGHRLIPGTHSKQRSSARWILPPWSSREVDDQQLGLRLGSGDQAQTVTLQQVFGDRKASPAHSGPRC